MIRSLGDRLLKANTQFSPHMNANYMVQYPSFHLMLFGDQPLSLSANSSAGLSCTIGCLLLMLITWPKEIGHAIPPTHFVTICKRQHHTCSLNAISPRQYGTKWLHISHFLIILLSMQQGDLKTE
jgi:hypothetical protein